ncbi:transporter [Xanthocytophaga flava]|uniref:transporter n=1 Tax=Xanthocytophaga flava TaxID=3048013 RepID=UPI0028D2CACA|nr:transporter [Xanthocytophaga flavus]MDJ1466548.1 transporter [Xanthocytophaga flavus]
MRKTLLSTGGLLAFLLLTTQSIFAQTPTDGLMMARGTYCTALSYSKTSWTDYWEGTHKRSNTNLGTVSTQTYMIMGALGITDRLNVIAGLPYIQTKASASYLTGQKGFQDVSLWLKYRLVQQDILFGTFRAFVTGGVSTPTNNYNPDYLPLSLGLHSKTASARLVIDYRSKPGFYLTAEAGYTGRSNIHIDRDSYLYNHELYNTNEVKVPNMADGNVRIGFRNGRFQTDVYLERMAALSGDDIRYNDMPFPTNAMKATTIGWYGRLNIEQFGITAGLSKVLDGRNVGQSTGFSVGVLYAVRVFGHGGKCGKPLGMESAVENDTH